MLRHHRALSSFLSVLLIVSLACGLNPFADEVTEGTDEALSMEVTLQSTAAPTETAVPTNTAVPTDTPAPTDTPVPTDTPEPEPTAVPTQTAEATDASPTPETDGEALALPDGYVPFRSDDGFVALAHPEGWVSLDLGGVIALASSEETLNAAFSSTPADEGAVILLEYGPFGEQGLIGVEFGPEPVTALAEFLESEDAEAFLGAIDSIEPVRPISFQDQPSAATSGLATLPESDTLYQFFLLYVAGPGHGVFYAGFVPADGDVELIDAIVRVPTTLVVSGGATLPIAEVSCANATGLVSITHPGEWTSESTDEEISISAAPDELGAFLGSGAPLISITAGEPDEIGIDDIDDFSDPALALQQFLDVISEEEPFDTAEVISPLTGLDIGDQRAARVTWRIVNPEDEQPYLLTLVFYKKGDLFGAFAAFVADELAPTETPRIEAIIDSFVLGPTLLPVCDHQPREDDGGVPPRPPGDPIVMLPGDIITGQKRDSGQVGVYSFVAQGEQILMIVASPEDENSDLVVELLDGDGTVLETVDFGISGQNEFVELETVAGVTYTIIVSEYFEERSAYSVAIIDISPDANSVLENISIELGQDETYLYSWDGQVGQPIMIWIESSDEMDLVLSLRGEAGISAGYSDSGYSAEPELLVAVPDTDGPLLFEISEFAGVPGTVTIIVYGILPQ